MTDRHIVSFYSISQGKKVRKRKEREERREKPPRAPPVSFPSATYLLPGLCPLTACKDGHSGTQSDFPLPTAGLSPAAPSGRTQPDGLLWRSGWHSRQQGRPSQTQAARAPAGKNRQSPVPGEGRKQAAGVAGLLYGCKEGSFRVWAGL